VSVSTLGSAIGRWLPSGFLKLSAGLHVGALAAVAAAPRLWPAALAVLAADHLTASAAGLVPRSRLLGPNLRRLPAGAGGAARAEVGLTFDDGPDPEVTPAVLERLDRRGHRASFFLIGRRAAAHPELVAEIVRRGHRVENHTWSHPNGFALLGPRAATAEIDRAQEALARLAGAPPGWFRPPAGLRSPWLEPLLARRGLNLASWTRRGYDTVSADPARVAARLTRGLAAGDLLLLHDGSSARGPGGAPVVLAALDRLLDALDDRGLAAVPLPAPPAAQAARLGAGDALGGTEAREATR
jgi:peptidoglycan/xylan/chitin deacetylase (PgdA/CDA1 family)